MNNRLSTNDRKSNLSASHPHDKNRILEMLSSDERFVLSKLNAEISTSQDVIADQLNWELVRVARSCLWLSNKGLITTEKKVNVKFIRTPMGDLYLKKGLPEIQIIEYLSTNQQVALTEIRDVVGLQKKEINAVIGILKRSNLVNVEKGILSLKSKSIDQILEYQEIIKNSEYSGVLEHQLLSIIKQLVDRNIYEKKTKASSEVLLTSLGTSLQKMLGVENPDQIVENITPYIIKNRSWVDKRFKRYDIQAYVPSLSSKRPHPLYWLMDIIKDIFVSMGFREVEGPWIDTAFWNMDSMFIPQDHPARDVQDTFYLGNNGQLPSAQLIKKIKAVQENGGPTGSKGYQSEWDEDIAKKLILRSHTTAVSFRTFYERIEKPCRAFSIGRIFRNETIDKTHLAEFHHIEGFVVAKGLTFRHLVGYLREFYGYFGITDIKLKPVYNPYTEPSMEVFCYYPPMEKWIEMGNSGIFRPEARYPYDIKENVIAWGLALERLATLIYGTKNLKELFGHECDFDFLSNYPIKPLGPQEVKE